MTFLDALNSKKNNAGNVHSYHKRSIWICDWL